VEYEQYQEKKENNNSWYVQNKQVALEQAANRMLTDKTLRKQNTERVKARLLNDTNYRNMNKLRATMKKEKKRTTLESRDSELSKIRTRIKTKLNKDRQYREEHRAKMRQHRKLKLQNNITYRDEHRQKMKLMYNKNLSYHNANKMRAKKRRQHLKRDQCHEKCHKKLTDRQKYWLRRSRLLAISRHRTELLTMKKKMEKESGV